MSIPTDSGEFEALQRLELDKIKEHMRLDIMRETASNTPGGQQYKSRIKNLLSRYIVFIGNVQNNKRFDGGEY